jgi:hypothetical protein
VSKHTSQYSQFALEIKSLYRSHRVTGRHIIKMRMFSPEMTQLRIRLRKELGFILGGATQSPTECLASQQISFTSARLSSTQQPLFARWGRKVLHLPTAFLTKSIRNFQMAMGTYESSDCSYEWVSRIDTRCSFDSNTRPQIIGFPFTGSP